MVIGAQGAEVTHLLTLPPIDVVDVVRWQSAQFARVHSFPLAHA
jgi:hypothetical protein